MFIISYYILLCYDTFYTYDLRNKSYYFILHMNTSKIITSHQCNHVYITGLYTMDRALRVQKCAQF